MNTGNNFGLITLNWDAAAPYVGLQIRDEAGDITIQQKVPLSVLKPGTLKGKGEVPRLAGLQPLHIARQLFDIQYGSSAGEGVAPMKPVVAKMTEDDIIAISAYLGSLPPA